MAGVQTCALPICFPVTIRSSYNEGRFGGIPDINYLKIASFISGDISTAMQDIDVEELSDGFFEEFDGDLSDE